jgi:microcystin-dependent protein
MPLNKLDNFIKNTEGRILYVNPNDLDATDSITNQGNSLAKPFKTIQRALIEAARFSYVKGDNNDLVEKTTILLFPGEHVVDNRPGYAIYDNGGAAFAVSRAGGAGVLASSVLSLDLDSNFDLTQEDNILYKFNSYYGGVVVPRGTSIIGLDLRKTKIRPKYVPNPTDSSVNNSALFRITGACYFWQFSMFDGDDTGLVYTNPDNFGAAYQSTPVFSHHKLTCFEFCDGVNKIGTYGLTDLDMYYSKVCNAYNAIRDIDQKFPVDSEGFAKQRPEWEIVGAFASDPITITSIISGNGSTANSVVTVTTEEAHGLNVGTPIKIRGVSGSGVTAPYNISTKVQNILSDTTFTYLLPGLASYPNINPSPSASSATVTIETDTVSGASPYIFNCSLRSVWGMNGLHADGSKASGFRSTVVAQFTAVSLQKDDRAFVKYDKTSRTYQGVNPIVPVYGSSLAEGASQTDSNQVYHLDSDAVYRSGWETSHIKISNDAFIQVVSVFAIGFTKHFDAESGGDASITNSNSNFGQISLNSAGFRRAAFDKDNNAFITAIIPPRAVDTTEEDDIEWLSLDVGLTTSVGISSHLYLAGFTASDSAPSSQTQGYRIGARLNDKLYFVGSGTTFSSDIYMCDNIIASSGFTTAIGTISAVKSYPVSSLTSSVFTLGNHKIQTGEKVIIISDDGDYPENIDAHRTYYAVRTSATEIKLATSYTNSISNQTLTVYGGTNLSILSRVSDKESGDIGSPVQFDPVNSSWFIHTNANNQIYNAFASGGTATYGTTTDLVYVKRISDERSLDEKLYKVRVVIPKELVNSKDPENGFIIQTSSSTGARNNADFTRISIASTDYGYNKNPRFISTCSAVSNTVTVISELPHNLQTGDIVAIKSVKSTTNTTGEYNLGYNGLFQISVTDDVTFEYSTTDVFGVAHTPGTFTSDVNVRNIELPRFERNDMQGNLYVYRNEVISQYVYNVQDGIYHLYVLDANNAVPSEFTNLKFSQLPVDLYPQLDRDNVNANPPSAKSFAKRSPIGDVVTNDLKKSITREASDLMLKSVGIGLTISSVVSTSGIATITFGRNHGFAGIVTYSSLTAGASYSNGTYYNVKLLNGSQTGSWGGATAKVVVSGGSVTSAEIIAPGSGYSAGALYFDQTRIGAGNGAARFNVVTSGISTNIGDVIQLTGAGTTSDGYYRINSVGSATTISIAKTSGDPTILSSQYAFLVGPSVRITGTDYTSRTGITTFTTVSAHGLVAGNQFRVIDSNNNNLGDYLVNERVGVNTFTAVTNKSIAATNGYILKHGLSSNQGVSNINGENIGTRSVPFYANETFTLSSSITTETTFSVLGVGATSNRLPLGSYIQIDNEILRVTSSDNNTQINVIRGALGTRQENHDAGSLIRKIDPVAIEFRRPSILRASGHTFEYLGYGPGNYSTGLPQIQVKTLTEREDFLAQSQERSGGVVVYTAMNSDGDVFNGNTKTSASSGETVSYDIPNPTVTGEDPSRLSVVYDEVTVKERLLVEGGDSGQVLSQFDGPVTFNKDLRIKAQSTFSGKVRFTNTDVDSINIFGGTNVYNNISVKGTNKLTFGDSVNLSIYTNGTNSFVDNSTGNLYLRNLSGDIRFESIGGETLAKFSVNGNNELYFDNAKKLETTSTGAIVTGITSTTDLNVSNNASITGTATIGQINSQSIAPIGSVVMWSGNVTSVPTGWLLCNGSAVSRTTFSALFAITGTTFGAGNGSTTFNLPNLMDRFVVGAGSAYARNATGGTTTHNHTGNTDGTALGITQIPRHNHTIGGDGDHNHLTVNSGEIGGSRFNSLVDNGGRPHMVRTGSYSQDNYRYAIAGTGSGPDSGRTNNGGFHSHGGGTGLSGGDGAGNTVAHTHPIQSANNLPPYIALGYIIRYA